MNLLVPYLTKTYGFGGRLKVKSFVVPGGGGEIKAIAKIRESPPRRLQQLQLRVVLAPQSDHRVASLQLGVALVSRRHLVVFLQRRLLREPLALSAFQLGCAAGVRRRRNSRLLYTIV